MSNSPRLLVGPLLLTLVLPAASQEGFLLPFEGLEPAPNGGSIEPIGMVLADFNGDGFLDVLTRGGTGLLQISLQKDVRRGDWLRTEFDFGLGTDSLEIRLAAGDVDGDGDQDAVAITAFGTVAWLENENGSGLQWTTHVIDSTPDNLMAVAAGDLDGDGRIEVVVAASSLDEVVVYDDPAGDGSAWDRTVAATADGPRTLALADLDADGDLDVAVGSDFDSALTVIENRLDVSGGWSAAVVGTSSCLHSLDVGDVDGDGRADLVAAGFCDRRVTWHRNPGALSGTWAETEVATLEEQPELVRVLDWDGDGVDDVVVSSWFSIFSEETTEVLRNGGDGSSWELELLYSQETTDIVVGDLDNDGDDDALLRGIDFVLRREIDTSGVQDWTTSTVLAAGDEESLVVRATADVDGDGDADLLLAVQPDGVGSGLDLARNVDPQSGRFVREPIIGLSGTRRVIAVLSADLDADGDVDLVVHLDDILEDAVDWYENLDGSGSTWVAHPITTSETSIYPIRLAPIDFGTGIDLFAATVDEPMRWFANTLPVGGGWEAQDPLVLFDAAELDRTREPDAFGTLYALRDGGGTTTLAQVETGGVGGIIDAEDLATVESGLLLQVGPMVGGVDEDVVTVADDGTVDLYEVLSSTGAARQRTISTSKLQELEGSGLHRLTDVDLDGLTDVVLPIGRGTLVWFEQEQDDFGLWRMHGISSESGSVVSLGDYEGDGDPDVFAVVDGDIVLHRNQAVCNLPASAVLRTDAGGQNALGFVADAPVQGQTWAASVDNTGTGATVAAVVGYRTATEVFVPLLGGALLVDLADPSGELLGLPPLAGTSVVAFAFDVPSDPGLCGFSLSTQGIGIGPGTVVLHNAFDLRLGGE